MIKACLFDLSCILVSPSKDRGVGVDDMSDVMGNESLDTLANPGGGFTGMSPETNRTRVQENTKTYWEYGGRQMPDMILPGALDFIKDLYRNGIKLASTATDCRPESVLSSVGLYGMFDYVVDPESVADRPDPEVLLKAVNNLGLKPEECIAFENTPEGIEAAKAAGIRSVAVGDLSELYHADMGVPEIKGLTLQALKDALEPRPSC